MTNVRIAVGTALAVALLTASAQAETIHERWLKSLVGQWTAANRSWTQDNGWVETPDSQRKASSIAGGLAVLVEAVDAAGVRTVEVFRYDRARKAIVADGFNSDGVTWQLVYDQLEDDSLAGTVAGKSAEGIAAQGTASMTKGDDGKLESSWIIKLEGGLEMKGESKLTPK